MTALGRAATLVRLVASLAGAVLVGCGGNSGDKSPTGPKSDVEVTVATAVGHTLNINKSLLEDTRIAFTTEDPDGFYSIRPDGTDRRTYSGSAPYENVSWSPDGASIALEVSDAIYTANPDGSALTEVFARESDHYPRILSWSPDGSELAIGVGTEDGAGGVYLVDVASPSLPRQLVSDGEYPGAWSPDGDMIAFTRRMSEGDQVWVIKTDGSGERLLVESVSLSWPGILSWSPDGSQIIFANTFTTQSYDDPTTQSKEELDIYSTEIFSVPLDGGNPRQLTDTFASDNPIWSPDGSAIVYERRNPSSGDSESDIIVVRTDGSAQILAQGDQPRWSPDGSKIIFHSGVEERVERLEMMNPDGTNRVTVIEGARHPFWSPFFPEGTFPDVPDIMEKRITLD